jgi:exopolysaccharide production protein ExoZ
MRRKLSFLQVLRAVAALLVVGDHVIYYLAEKEDVASTYQNIAWHLGTFGVDIFFVISGFIMIHTTQNLFGTQRGFAQFAYRRINRIVPMYWLATSVALGLLLRHQFPSNFELIGSFLFIPVVTDPGHALRPILGVGWTLNLEMFFYALFTLALLFSRRVGTILLVSCLTLLVAAGTFLKPLGDTSDPTTTATFLSDPIMLLFAAGVILGSWLERPAGLKIRLPFAGPLSIALVAAGIAIFIEFVDKAPWPLGWQLLFWGLSIAIVFLAVVALDEPKSRVVGFFEALGDASYCIYLFHFIIITAVGRLWLDLFGGALKPVFVPIAFIAAGGAGLAIHLWIERPLLAALRFLRPTLSRLWAAAPGG